MQVSIQTLLKAVQTKFPIKLIAGKKGSKNMTQWVSVVDNDKVVPYVRENELVITTGFALKSEKELIDMCINLHKNNASGFIINEGFYIKRIPEEVICYCNENHFPLMTFPWEVRIMDVIGEMDRVIFEKERMNGNVIELLKDILFIENVPKEKYEILSRNGYDEESFYTLIVLESREEELLGKTDQILLGLQRIFHSYENQMANFGYENQILIVLKNCKNDELHRFMDEIMRIMCNLQIQDAVFAVISSRKEKIHRLRECYQRLKNAISLGMRREQHIIYYEELDIYRLLLSIENKKQLRKYHDDVLKRIQEYDDLNHTKLFLLLQQYINTNGCIQAMAEMNYVHRNTINYQLKKIESITGWNLSHWDVRMKVQLAMLIHEML